MRVSKHMTNTGERREITARLNAKESETVKQAQNLTSRIKQLIASKDAKNQVRSAKAARSSFRKGRA
jgi:hypothetical protein